ncbi:MAG: prolipoprotein diacylglyceryl transferase [Planctomycetota bacterium]
MHQNLFEIPIFIVALIGGGLLSASIFTDAKRSAVMWLIIAMSATVAGALAYSRWSMATIPVRGYGVMILIGFLVGVWMAARRAQWIGIEPRHCVNIGIFGVFLGLVGARIFHIIMHWPIYNPFLADGFNIWRVWDMVKVWEGGLVFYGTFVVVVPWAWIYCRCHKLPALSFLDLAAPCLIAGLAFGRIGCFLNGCCYGKLCDLPWAIRFPRHSPPYDCQMRTEMIHGYEPYTQAIHPTQIYAALAAALIAVFLYALWPRRRYDGQILSYMLIMAGVSRFFEELLRADESAAFPSVSISLTIAQWFAIGIALLGIGLLIRFRRCRVRHS